MEDNSTYELTTEKAARFYIGSILSPKVKELEQKVVSLICEFENENECGIRIISGANGSRIKFEPSQPYS